MDFAFSTSPVFRRKTPPLPFSREYHSRIFPSSIELDPLKIRRWTEVKSGHSLQFQSVLNTADFHLGHANIIRSPIAPRSQHKRCFEFRLGCRLCG
jgi:hypothetical protein